MKEGIKNERRGERADIKKTGTIRGVFSANAKQLNVVLIQFSDAAGILKSKPVSFYFSQNSKAPSSSVTVMEAQAAYYSFTFKVN